MLNVAVEYKGPMHENDLLHIWMALLKIMSIENF